ncbi:ParB/RepB/Spo0J family partition protein [Candidatus Uhrbacteria bacterium]|nr:ParB/RepB/Spo0J family partition protein [Candidatus Uhrbacteria bacterium]
MSSPSLGRGLDALLSRKLPVSSTPPSPRHTNDGTPIQVSVDGIKANNKQPRYSFNDDQLNELAESIREYGIIQPLVVMREGEGYRLIAGERRLRAAKKIGLSTVPVVVRDAADHERLALALIENVQRVDLNPIELAFGYKQLLEEFQISHEELGRRIGKSRPVITNTIRMLQLPQMIQEGIKEGKINEGHTRHLLSVRDEEKQRELYNSIVANKLTYGDAERIMRQMTGKPAPQARRVKGNLSPDPLIAQKEGHLREYFGTKVHIEKNGEKGSIVIDFYSLEQMRDLISKLLGA